MDGPIKKIYRLCENQYYKLEKLSQLLDCSDLEATAFVEYMRKQEVCKTDLYNKTFSFRYVGLVEFECNGGASVGDKRRRMVFIEPKFFDPETRSEVAGDGMDESQKILLKAILKYRKSQQVSLFSSGRLTSYEGCSTRLSTNLAFILDVMEKGVYQVPKMELVVNGQGDIDWNETFEAVDPIFLQDGPCYANTINREMGYDDDTYISRLQMCLASKCISYFEEIGLAEPLGLFLDSPYDGDIADFGSEAYCASRVENELRTQFIDDKQQTLKLMQAVLNNMAYGSDSLEFQSFGMSGFHTLWERAIKDVFCDELERTPRQIFNEHELERVSGRDHNLIPKLDRALKEFIDAPRWIKIGADDGGVTAQSDDETDRLKPDFVAVARDEDKATALIILDAKYYKPEFKESSILFAPGVGDVDKQVLYQLAYDGIVAPCDLKVHNAFMFPKWYQNWNDDKIKAELFAKISVPSFGPLESFNGETPTFKAYMLDGMGLLKRYVHNESDYEHKSLIEILEAKGEA